VNSVLQQLGRKFTASQTNFVFFHTGIPIDRFQELMKKEQIHVARPFPPMLDWCRITIGLPDEMKLINQALRKILS
jgi:histidinol-phosphate aminotransferase